jgi:hypothetical protein
MENFLNTAPSQLKNDLQITRINSQPTFDNYANINYALNYKMQ